MASIDRELLRKLHQTSGQLRAITEHLKQLADDLDDVIDQTSPHTGPLDPSKAPPEQPPSL
jgi:hypothetical protein